MPRNTTESWLLCYDIADPRRLQRVHRYVKSIAIALQYSVFLWQGSAAELAQVRAQLQQLINEKEDDIRIYPLHRKPKKYTIGTGLFARGVMLFHNGIDRLK